MPLRKLAGPLLLMLGLPPLTYYMWLCLRYYDGALVLPTSGGAWLALAVRVPGPTLQAVVLYGGWFLLQVVLQAAGPGKIYAGTPLADGSRLNYKMNGWFALWCTLAAVAVVVAAGWVSPTVVYDAFGPLLTTVHLFAFAFSFYLYLHGMASRQSAATGNFIYDYFMGVSLNPRVGSFDWKFFCESRPGLLLWLVFDLSLAAKQYQLHGTVTTAMLLVVAFQVLYVADYFFFEDAILTTWDIKYEKFGWMLCWGDLVWVPFTYTLQAHYLVDHPHALSAATTVGILVLNLLGYYLFRSTNIQKHRFRQNPTGLVWGKPPTYIRTAQGTLLLTSGWWGVARHLNYLGDLCMALAWCLPTLFGHPLTYFYFIYMVILLVHRERRDHIACQTKYSQDWEAYCQKVRWRILPGIY